jgi:hypothetical protein
MAPSERYNAIKKMGKKLIKYLEVIKWLTFNNLQNRYSPPIGRTKVVKRTIAFFLCFEKIGKRIRRITEVIIRGKWGTQSCNIPYMIPTKEMGTLA